MKESIFQNSVFNIGKAITEAKMQLGLMAFSTPFPDIDETLTYILENFTLPTFSVYKPDVRETFLNLRHCRMIENHGSVKKYILPEIYSNVIYLMDVNYDDTGYSGINLDAPIRAHTTDVLSNYIYAAASSNLLREEYSGFTWNFEYPRTLTMYNLICSDRMLFKFGYMHSPSLNTITNATRIAFMKLFLLDIKYYLYPTMKHYTEINTAHGTINLKLDDWADAENKRNDLLDEWENTFYYDFPSFYRG